MQSIVVVKSTKWSGWPFDLWSRWLEAYSCWKSRLFSLAQPPCACDIVVGSRNIRVLFLLQDGS